MSEPNYTLLDCDKKALLRMPSAAAHLWLAYFMNEDIECESFMSIETIEEQTGMSRRSIVDWTAWLVARGWLVDTEKKAADKWLAMGRVPTRGAWQVRVYRAVQLDLPTNMDKVTSAESALEESHQCKSCTSADSAHKVLISSSVLSSLSLPLPSTRFDDILPKEKYRQERGEIQKKMQNPKPKTSRVAKDGSPVPQDLDTWTLDERLAWSQEHNGTGRANSNGQTNVSLPKEEAKTKPQLSPDWRGVPYSAMELDMGLDDFGDKITAETEVTRLRLARLIKQKQRTPWTTMGDETDSLERDIPNMDDL